MAVVGLDIVDAAPDEHWMDVAVAAADCTGGIADVGEMKDESESYLAYVQIVANLVLVVDSIDLVEHTAKYIEVDETALKVFG